MQLVLDHITSVLVSGVVLLAGLTMLGVANRAGVRVALSLAATGNHLWLTEVLDQDLVNLGARPFDPHKAVEAYSLDPKNGYLQFAAPIEADGGVNKVRWTWTQNGTVEVDSAGVRMTVPRYDVVRYVGDGALFSASSRGWAARFRLLLLDRDRQPVGADSVSLTLARHVQVQVLTLTRQWGNRPSYRFQNDYRAVYSPVNLHK